MRSPRQATSTRVSSPSPLAPRRKRRCGTTWRESAPRATWPVSRPAASSTTCGRAASDGSADPVPLLRDEELETGAAAARVVDEVAAVRVGIGPGDREPEAVAGLAAA